MTTNAESINSNLQRGLDSRFRHKTLETEQNQLAIKVSADNKYYSNASSIDSGVFANSNPDRLNQRDSNPRHSDVH